MNPKKLPILESYITYLKFTRGYSMHQEELSFQNGEITPTEKVSEFLDHHLKSIMQKGWSYIKDTEDFFKKVQNMEKILKILS